MITLVLVLFALCSSTYAIAPAITSPRPTPLARREDAINIPTFTVGPSSKYVPAKANNPEPAGTSLKIYPTGSYESFPEEGITVAFGPELQTQIKDTAAQHCQSNELSQQCQDALMPLLQNTDVAAHSKRFLFLTAIVAISVEIAIGAILASWFMGSKASPAEIKLDRGDLSQIYSMEGAHTFAAVTIGATGLPQTLTYKPAPTKPTVTFISVETLTADKDNHKAGSVVYSIPKDVGARIQDFLAITGIQETQTICKGRNVRRADDLQECLSRIQRHALDLADIGPENLMPLAQYNIPGVPNPGQPIRFPVENIAMDGVILVLPVYRIVRQRAQVAAVNDQGWDPSVFVKSAMAVTFAAHAAMFAGTQLLELFVDKEKLAKDISPEIFACKQEIICTADDCTGQQDGKNIRGLSPICKKQENYGCRCMPVSYPHVMTLEKDYMDEQYAWLEELIKKSDRPPFKSECSPGKYGEQKLAGATQKWEHVVEAFCKDNSLDNDSNKSELLENGFTSGLYFVRNKQGPKCDFECSELFLAFTKAGGCIGPESLWQLGEIKTECGTGSYNAYKLGQ